MLQFSVQNKQLLDGYAAFNEATSADDARWEIVKGLFCEDFTEDGERFPAWHPMDGTAAKRGRQEIIEYLQWLRGQGTTAQLLGVASQGNALITLDFTTGGDEGPHACADKIVLSESGCIKEVWHCSTATHQHGKHPGHPAEGHTHT
jgi:hypothetical protein